MASADGTANTNQTQEASNGPVLCTKNCGFFGNATTGGMCSKCYKETLAKAAPAPSAPAEPKVAAPPAPAPAPPAPPPAAVEIKPAASPAASAAASSSSAPVAEPAPAVSPAVGLARPCEEPADDEEPPKKVQANTSRCWTCNRKIGLLGFQCKCEYFFCAEHRYSDKHECGFNFKKQGKELLAKQNPTIAPSKMESV